MGTNQSKNKKRASRPAGPSSEPQRSHTGYVGPAPVGPFLNPADLPPAETESADPYAVTGWGEASGIGEMADVRCPSGQLALCRRPGVQGLIEAGILHEMDSLTGLVDNKHLKRVKGGGQEIDAKTLMRDPKQLAKVMAVVDKAIVHIVVKPSLTLAWTESESGERRELTKGEREKLAEDAGRQLIFTDTVELDDKMFIFNYAVGGTRSLERFRQQSADVMGGMEAGDTVEDTA